MSYVRKILNKISIRILNCDIDVSQKLNSYNLINPKHKIK